MAWVIVFLPAFSYYMSTRLFTFGLFRSSTIGVPFQYEVVMTATITSAGQCSSLSEIFPIDCRSTGPPRGTLFKILEEPNTVATTWKHDEELGRGYLLLSTSLEKGKVWRWETGGGPIPIGRTLHLKDSGCRSKPNTECSVDNDQSGSGGLVIDIWHNPPRLIIAEWGEGRIVRLEPESGARTPLIIQHYQEGYQVQAPTQLFLTAFGDLIILDSHTSTTTSTTTLDDEEEKIETSVETKQILWHLPQVSKISPLKSLTESREAHFWTSLPSPPPSTTTTTTEAKIPTSTNMNIIPQRILEQSRIGGVISVPNEWTEIYVTMSMGDNYTAVLGILPLDVGEENSNDEEEDDDITTTTTTTTTTNPQQQSRLLIDYSQYASVPGPIVVDDTGRLYLAIDGGFLVVEPPNKIKGHIRLPDISDPIVSLTLGEDRFLYIATKWALYRMKTRVKPLVIPTNLVI